MSVPGRNIQLESLEGRCTYYDQILSKIVENLLQLLVTHRVALELPP